MEDENGIERDSSSYWSLPEKRWRDDTVEERGAGLTADRQCRRRPREAEVEASFSAQCQQVRQHNCLALVRLVPQIWELSLAWVGAKIQLLLFYLRPFQCTKRYFPCTKHFCVAGSTVIFEKCLVCQLSLWHSYYEGNGINSPPGHLHRACSNRLYFCHWTL